MDPELRPLIDAHRDLEGPLLPLLHALQREYGHIPETSFASIAEALNLSVAEVHGVVSFYHDFTTVPRGRHVVAICGAEACQARGSRALDVHARERLGIDFGETTADGTVTLERVFCLGNCACGPSLRIGDRVHANVDAARFDALVAALQGESS
jgi:formate dehydrogenase subunit gamma